MNKIKFKANLPLFSLILSGVLILLFIVSYGVFGSFAVVTRALGGASVLALALLALLHRAALIGFFRKSGTVTGLTRLLQFIVVAVILVFVYMLSDSLPLKIDLTTSRLFTLSDETKLILKSVTNEFKITVFRSYSVSDPRLVSLFEYQKGLLKTYADRNPKIKLSFVDPQINRAMALDYDIKDEGAAVFEYQGNRVQSGISQIVENDQQSGKTSFKGELVYSKAVKNLLASKPKDIYVLIGHGELTPGNKGNRGWNEIFDKLKGESATLHGLDLTKNPTIPASCSLLLIGNPVRPIGPNELDAIRNYMQDGGSVLMLLEYETTPLVNDLLKEAGLFYLKNMVIEGEYYNPQLGQSVLLPKVLAHETTMPLLKGQLAVIMPTACAIQQLPESEKDKNSTYFTFPLLKTSDNSYGETSDEQIRGSKFKQDKGDLKGPMYTAFATRRVKQNIVTTRDGYVTNSLETRLVVFGDSDFVNNSYEYMSGNSDLFLNSVNWLLKREGAITIRPKTSEIQQFQLGSAAKRFLTILAFALAVCYFVPGLLYVLRRRSKVKV